MGRAESFCLQYREMPEFDKTQIFVGNLSLATDNASLKRAFTRFGKVINSQIDANKMCGFVTFENEVSVQNIMAEAMLGTTVFEVDGVKVVVKPKIKKEKAEKQSKQLELNPKKIFVSGLSKEITSNDLKAHFTKWGLITEAYTVADKYIGFITFKHASDVQQLLMRTMTGEKHIIKGKDLTIQPATADKKPAETEKKPTEEPNAQKAEKPKKAKKQKGNNNEKQNKAENKKADDQKELTELKAKCMDLQTENDKLKEEKKTTQSKNAKQVNELNQEIKLLKQKLMLAEANVESLLKQSSTK